MCVVLSQKRQLLVALAPTVFGHVCGVQLYISGRDRTLSGGVVIIASAPGTAVSHDRMPVCSHAAMFLYGTRTMPQLVIRASDLYGNVGTGLSRPRGRFIASATRPFEQFFLLMVKESERRSNARQERINFIHEKRREHFKRGSVCQIDGVV